MSHKLGLILRIGLFLCLSCNKKDGPTLAPLLPGHHLATHEAKSTQYMISTQGKVSTQAGVKMFELGGNAFDAFTAISFAISVERPQSTGIGGGGFLLYYHPSMSEPHSLDFREKAPLQSHKKIFLDKDGKEIPRKSLDGIFAGGIPGLVAGVLEAHKKFGKLPLKTVMAPAIALARDGFSVYPHLAMSLEKRKEVIAKFESSKKIFFNEKGEPLKEGDLLVQEDLFKTLTLISEQGAKAFYSGKIAQAFVNESKRRGGVFTLEDFKKYNVVERRPVKGTYKGHEVYSMGPPSSGGIHIIQILNILEGYNLKEKGVLTADSVHHISSAMQLAFADRAKFLGDSDFVKVPIKGLISKSYAKELRKKITKNKAIPSDQIYHGSPFKYESDQTTHFTVVDKEGNILTSTQTINGLMGSALVIEGTGIVLNNEMDDFATKPGAQNLFGAVGGEANLVEPGKRPLSSMSPTIVFKKGKPLLALGTPSGTRILTCVAQTILNYIEFNLPLYESVAAVRYHHQWRPDYIRLDDQAPKKLVQNLEGMGYKVKKKNLGCKVQAISFENGLLHGVSDPRGEGMSLGK